MRVALQVAYGLMYYAGVLVVVRLAGKRLAGQVTGFDLVVLIQLAVVLQTVLLRPGAWNAVVFVATVLAAHRGLAIACARWDFVRQAVRGAPRVLVRDGHVLDNALEAERMAENELLAGLRKLGFGSPADVQLAVLEETGHISAIGFGPARQGGGNR